MRSTAEPETDPFARHYVDLAQSGAGRAITARLELSGLVTFGGLSARGAVLGLASRVMRIVQHRDSGRDGLTAIYATGRHDDRPGFAGFTDAELALHTEGTALRCPPRLMLLVCTQPAPRGGHTLLVDGRSVYADLAERSPEVVEALSNPRAGYFGRSGGIFAPAFAQHEGGRVSVRYRQDAFVRWSPLAEMHLHALKLSATRTQQMLTLRAGQGYLLDNHRWLHARTAFDGARRCYRALGNPHTPAPPGFLPRTTTGGAA